MPYLIEVSGHFSAAHRLRGYRGKCENLHGHNWKVAASFAAAEPDETGLVVDFATARQWLAAVLEELDHVNLEDIPHFQRVNTTSENIARYIYDRVCEPAGRAGLRTEAVAVWESENSKAVYRP